MYIYLYVSKNKQPLMWITKTILFLFEPRVKDRVLTLYQKR